MDKSFDEIRNVIWHGDCLELMTDIPDGSVDMILCDPPYGTVKNIGNSNKISHGMSGKTGWDICLNHNVMLNHYNRILRVGGALLLFSQDPYTGKLMTQQHGNLPFSYRLVWLKDHFANALIAKKAPVNYTEDICVFFKKYDTLNQHPLREYVKLLLNYIQKSLSQINVDLGHRKAEHFFYVTTMQFGLCTEETYNELIKKYKINKMIGFISYKELQEINNNSKFVRTFNLPTESKYKSNVFEYKKDYARLHPTQKPIKLIEDLIMTYTNKGDMVLDNCAGSGTTAIACIKTDRNYILIEQEQKYIDIINKRIDDATRQGRLF